MEEFIALDNLSQSTEYMNSDDWKKRFIAEYAQLVTRIDILLDILWEDENPKDTVQCPIELISMQINSMSEYKRMLEIRADIYGIDLNDEIKKLQNK